MFNRILILVVGLFVGYCMIWGGSVLINAAAPSWGEWKWAPFGVVIFCIIALVVGIVMIGAFVSAFDKTFKADAGVDAEYALIAGIFFSAVCFIYGTFAQPIESGVFTNAWWTLWDFLPAIALVPTVMCFYGIAVEARSRSRRNDNIRRVA